MRIQHCGLQKVLFALLLVLTTTGHAATNDLSRLLQQGLFEEEANHNLEAAAKAYESVVSAFDKDRKLAATAVFRLGEVARKQGKTNEANVYYERVAREFPDQKTLVELSRKYVPGPDLLRPGSPRSSLIPSSPSNLHNRLLVDNQQAEFIGTWRVAGVASDRYADDYRFARTTGTNPSGQQTIASFRPVIPATGKYHVEVWYPSGEDRSTNSQWKIFSGEEKEIPWISVDQSKNAGKWFRIASDAHFVRGTTLVQLWNATGESNAVVVADAVRLIPVDGSSSTAPRDVSGVEVTSVLDDEQAEIRRVQRLIKDSPDLINAVSPAERPLLHKAAATNHLEVVRFLLDNGANINLRDAGEATALHSAVMVGNKGITELLLSRGANVNAADSTGRTPLHVAAFCAYKTVAELLLASKADPNAKTKGGYTPLHEAVPAGHRAIVELLVKNGADVNGARKEGEYTPTPLLSAVQKKQHEVAKLLIENKADVNAGSKDNFNEKELTPLHEAVKNDDLAMAEMLLKAGANPNLPFALSMTRPHGHDQYNGVRPLDVAVMKDLVAMTELLLKHKADPNALDTYGIAPLHRASSTNVAELLLASGADMNEAMGSERTEGYTALHAAVNMGNRKVVSFLLERGANPNTPNKKGVTPLHAAVQARDKELVELLLKAKADPNMEDAQGQTPLDLVNSAGTRAMGQPVTGELALGVLKDIGNMLAKYGADEFRKARKEISLTRNRTLGFAPFHKGTNVVNRFTVLELVAYVYGQADWQNDVQQQLAFPDFANVKIHRLDSSNVITVDVFKILENGECKNDVWLEWGDVVVVPEADHPLSEQWTWPSHQMENVRFCLRRNVEVIVKGEKKVITLEPGVRGTQRSTGKKSAYIPNPSGTKVANSCWAREVVRQSGMLLASSDRSRVKIKRSDPITKKPIEMVVSLFEENRATDVWLRDGDVIEIPERDPNAPVVQESSVPPPPTSSGDYIPLPTAQPEIRQIPTKTLRIPPVSQALEPSTPTQTRAMPTRTLKVPPPPVAVTNVPRSKP